MSDTEPELPPLPPTPYPDDLLARCSAAFLASTVRTPKATLEVHRTHLRIVTPVVRDVTEFARRMDVDDLVLGADDIDALRPVGAMAVIVELPHRAAVAVAGPAVRDALRAWEDRIPVEQRSFRPFFVNFWLIHNRTGRVLDSRPMN